MMLAQKFFAKDAQQLAQDLLGMVIRAKYKTLWLAAQITETEAYYIDDKASHASLGFTEKRKALFMPPGTIYMYYARGGDSLNVSAKGEGNAVLIKSAIPYCEANAKQMILTMQRLNPIKGSGRVRKPVKLCAGQTLLCRSLNLKVPEWDQQQFCHERLYFEDVGCRPHSYEQAPRRGIPQGRDEHLLYRFIAKGLEYDMLV